ncbi:hypothetical protein KKA53_00520 [Candidatus Dependentiae bacterium]|nr:hypothetical protein [Candidatus Dependentiae bacterium]
MIQLKKTLFLKLFLLLTPVFARADQTTRPSTWTIMIYAQTDSILNNFVLQNFNAMANVGSNKKLNIIVQWNQPQKEGTWRYKIEKNKMVLIETCQTKRSHDFSHDIINFANFAATRYPAENYVFILSNHGVGIIDPEWNRLQNFAVNPTALQESQRIQIDGITKTYNKLSAKRGILFDIPNKTYLKNEGLTGAFSYITRYIIKKKFALIGMDACLMSMFEVFYQIRDYADYSVSSEEVELAQGWNYAPFLYALANSNLTTQELAKNIVFTFEDFYKNKTKFYTQSAIDLEGIEFIKNNIDQIVSNITLCKPLAPKAMQCAIENARNLCFQLSIPCYIDLHSFYTELYKQISSMELKTSTRAPRRSIPQPIHASQQFKDLKESLLIGMQLLDSTIIASIASPYLSRARGISIYFPTINQSSQTKKVCIDPSYLKTEFAKESLWLSLIKSS